MRILFSTFFTLTFGLSLFTFALVPPVQAQSAGNDALKFLDATAVKGGLTEENNNRPASRKEVVRIIGNIINTVLGFVGIIFFVQVLWAGIRWMTAGGNEQVIEESKATLKASVIGIVIALSAFLITNFVLVQVRNVVTTTYIDTLYPPTV